MIVKALADSWEHLGTAGKWDVVIVAAFVIIAVVSVWAVGDHGKDAYRGTHMLRGPLGKLADYGRRWKAYQSGHGRRTGRQRPAPAGWLIPKTADVEGLATA